MPTAPAGETAVADVGRLYAALNTQVPGLATISERWRVGGGLKPDAGRELRLAAVAEAAERDPLARGVIGALRILAALGGLVALAAAGLAVAGSARDRGGEQAELEAIGVPPRTLRAQMVAVALATAAAGLAAGVLGGAVLTNRFPDLLALGADGRRPLPELVPGFPWTTATTAALLAALATTAAAAIQARRAFRGDTLGRLRA
jgi:hypothetical protein